MLILAIDTATPSCSAAVTRGRRLLAETTFLGGRTHSTHLLKVVEGVLSMACVEMQDIDGFAVSVGPGTFTGLRIGISTVKGLAFALNRPVAGVCSLEALAWQFPYASVDIMPMIDARRGEVYFSKYGFEKGQIVNLVKPCVASPEKAVVGEIQPVLFTGSGAVLYKNEIERHLGENALFSHDSQNTIRASSVAMLGLKRMKNNGGFDAETLTPLYLRKSDAQIHLEARKIKA